MDFETAMWTISGESELLDVVRYSQREDGPKMDMLHIAPLLLQALAIL